MNTILPEFKKRVFFGWSYSSLQSHFSLYLNNELHIRNRTVTFPDHDPLYEYESEIDLCFLSLGEFLYSLHDSHGQCAYREARDQVEHFSEEGVDFESDKKHHGGLCSIELLILALA